MITIEGGVYLVGKKRGHQKTHKTIKVGVGFNQKLKSSLMYGTRKRNALIWSEGYMQMPAKSDLKNLHPEAFPNSILFNRPLSTLSDLCYQPLWLICLTSMPTLWFCCCCCCFSVLMLWLLVSFPSFNFRSQTFQINSQQQQNISKMINNKEKCSKLRRKWIHNHLQLFYARNLSRTKVKE